VQSQHILTTNPPNPDFRFGYGNDPNQFLDVYIPHDSRAPHPLVCFIHGGYWRAKYDLTYAGHFCHALKQAGIATCNVEYRRVGNPGGGWPGTFQDICAAYGFITEPQANSAPAEFDLNRVCIAGHSAGGQLALCLAARHPKINRVVSLAGVVDLRRAWELDLSNDAVAEFLGGSPDNVPDRYREASPTEQSIKARQILIHGTADDSVPYELSKTYAEHKKKQGENVELITLPETGHFEIVHPESSVWSTVQRAFISLSS
jgi:acetyl esterase/lipase